MQRQNGPPPPLLLHAVHGMRMLHTRHAKPGAKQSLPTPLPHLHHFSRVQAQAGAR